MMMEIFLPLLLTTTLLIFGTHSLDAAPSLVNAQPFILADLTLGAYTYKYHSEVAIQQDNISSRSHGFQFDAIVQFQDVFYDANNRLIRIYLDEAKFNQQDSNAVKPSYKGGEWFDSYAHVITRSNGTAYVKQFYSKQNDFITYNNIKKSIILNLIPTNLHLATKDSQTKYSDNNFVAQPELFSPDTYSEVSLNAQLSDGRSNIFQQVDAYQNVTFKSRVYASAGSLLQTQINLKLIKTDNSLLSKQKEIFSHAQSIEKAIALLLPRGYYPESISLQRVNKICSHHHCAKTLNDLFQDYRKCLTTKSIATVDAAVAYLKILARLREYDGSSLTDISNIIKKLKKSEESAVGALDSFLDILAAARTKDSIMAALKFLKLPKNTNLDMAERFLSALSVSANTAAKMHLNRPLHSPYSFAPTPALSKSSMVRVAPQASLAFIAYEILNLFEYKDSEDWASHKLRWSTLLTLSSLVRAHNQENNFVNLDDELNSKVESLLISELNECDRDPDCRVVVIQAIGNIGNLNEANFKQLENQILDSGRRESIASMKALRDCLQNCAAGQHLSLSFYKNIKDLLIRVAYDDHQETTARVLASELIVRFIPDSLASDQLLTHLPSFDNNELATMIHSRVMSLRPDSKNGNAANWYWKSCIINGSSASFVKTMAETPSVNASYGVNVELNAKKLLKESSFDVMLDTNQRRQDLFSLGIFVRGLDEDNDESMMAGMTLRLLGSYLRPYIFFKGKKELMYHIFQGTASEPLTAFNADLLLIDHDEGYPLISGFVAEQQMRGVLSIEVTGNGSVSFWYSTSDSLVRTKASVIVQSLQSVFTGHENMWSSHLYSFGGHAIVDFSSDLRDFLSDPELCLQVVQPEFKFRHNSRRHERLLTDHIQRRGAGKVVTVGAKSYSLNKENNEMCSRVFKD